MIRVLAAAVLVIGIPISAFSADLPTPSLTPGVTRDLTVQTICATKWGKDARAVTAAMKRQVMTSYHKKPSDCPSGKIEIDHLISRELGGADDVKNLWPECYEKPLPLTPAELKAKAAGKKVKPRYDPKDMGAHKKDRVENRLHVEMCAGTVALKDAQREIATDWIKAYRRYIGPAP